jgi:cell division protein FtsZ
MKDAGAAVMGSAIMEGENRAQRAAEAAITSPLLNNTNIHGAKYILLSISAGNEEEFQMEELEEITEFVQERAGEDAEIIFGMAYDDDLGKALSVTVIATGFQSQIQQASQHKSTQAAVSHTPIQQAPVAQEATPPPTVEESSEEKQVIDLESEKKSKAPVYSWGGNRDFFDSDDKDEADDLSFFDIRQNRGKESEREKEPQREDVKFEVGGNYEIVDNHDNQQQQEMEDRYRRRQERIDANLRRVSEMSSEELKEKQETPAYLRKGMKLGGQQHSSEENISRYYLNDDDELLGDNKFLHDNVD